MAKRLIDLFRMAVPLKEEKKRLLWKLSDYIGTGEARDVISLVKQKKADIEMSGLNVSPQLLAEREFPVINLKTDDKRTAEYVEKINTAISGKIKEKAFLEFSKNASDIIPKFIAMNIVGLEEVKRAVAIQLFAASIEPVHILLLGDPGTGKTDILRSAAKLNPVSSLGLGSGTTGVGLTVTVKGEEVSKGLLPMADKGICAIDELNLMQEKDRGSLYNAMEKGFISYDKGGKHYKFDARVKVIATANPKGDRFVGWTLETLKKQLPFDAALLSRFHLVFLIRKPDVEQFVEISKKILKNDRKKVLSGDEQFIKDYIQYAEKTAVEIPSELEKEIVDIIAEIKKNERRYLIEISPRLVIGFVRMARASARMRLSQKVTTEDISTVKDIVMHGLRLDR